jgi:hypothetical protein
MATVLCQIRRSEQQVLDLMCIIGGYRHVTAYRQVFLLEENFSIHDAYLEMWVLKVGHRGSHEAIGQLRTPSLHMF